MNLYLVERTDPIGYDAFESFVVVSESEEKARLYQPKEYATYLDTEEFHGWTNDSESLKVTLIGIALSEFKEGHCITTSFLNG